MIQFQVVIGYPLVFLQYSMECYCGGADWTPKYGRAAESDCNYGCYGDLDQICGGDYRNSVYFVNRSGNMKIPYYLCKCIV